MRLKIFAIVERWVTLILLFFTSTHRNNDVATSLLCLFQIPYSSEMSVANEEVPQDESAATDNGVVDDASMEFTEVCPFLAAFNTLSGHRRHQRKNQADWRRGSQDPWDADRLQHELLFARRQPFREQLVFGGEGRNRQPFGVRRKRWLQFEARPARGTFP